MVSASREIAASQERIFELIADPAQQPRWDGNDNLAEAPAGQRVHAVGAVFTMTLTHDGAIRENHVAEFEEGRRIAWRPAGARSGTIGSFGSSATATVSRSSASPTRSWRTTAACSRARASKEISRPRKPRIRQEIVCGPAPVHRTLR